ncbi:hypothetical protein HID58_067503, partial [Brassica napus]
MVCAYSSHSWLLEIVSPKKVEEKKIAAWGSDVPNDLELNEEALANALRI